MRNTPVLSKIICALAALVLTVFSWSAVAADERTPIAYGIDVSRWQGDIDFRAVAADGIDFVILRVGYWDTQDVNFDKYYEGARSAGLDIGAYLYSYSKSEEDARFEAQNALSWLEGKRFEYPIFYDIEDASQSTLTNEQRTALCLAFGDELEKNGYLAGVYANQNWFNNYLERTDIEHMPLWIAKWTADATPTGDPGEPYGMWQYTDKGYVDGIVNDKGEPRTVDLDVSYTDYPTYIKNNGYNGYEKPDDPPAGLPFTDVEEGKWYHESIEYAYENGLMNGISATRFSPDEPVTRGMFVTILGRMSGVDTEAYTGSAFLDVDMTRYYGPYVAWAHENGIVDGVGGGMFSPDGQITREQMCKIIYGYLTYADKAIGGGPVEKFTDDGEISHWAHDSVYALAGAGIIKGVGGGAFSPKGSATRAECATIMMRVHKIGLE